VLGPTLVRDGTQRVSRERSEIDRFQLSLYQPADKGIEAGRLGKANRVREKTQEEPREIGAALAVGKPSGDGRGKIGLIEPCFHRCCIEEMPLDEFAELLANAALVGRDDGGVRYRQAQGMAKQRDDSVPIGQSADRGGLGKSGNKAKRGVAFGQRSRNDKNGERAGQHRVGERLHAPQVVSSPNIYSR
jgi:hypothetical protein